MDSQVIYGQFLSVIILVGCSKPFTNTEQAGTQNNIVSSYDKVDAGKAVNLQYNNFLYPEFSIYDESGAFLLTENSDGSRTIDYVDFNSKQQTVLCSELVCEHDNEICKAYIPPDVGGRALAKVGDKLVVFIMGVEDIVVPTIKTFDFKTSLWSESAQFTANNRIELPYAIGDGSIYFVLTTTNISKENSIVTNSKALVKLDFSNMKIEHIFNMDEQVSFKGVALNKFVFTKIEAPMNRVFLVNADGQSVNDDFFVFNYQSGKEFLVSGRIMFMNYEKNIMEEIFLDGRASILFPLHFQGQIGLTYLRYVSDDLIILDNTTVESDSETSEKKRYVINAKTGETSEVKIIVKEGSKSNSMWVHAITSEYVLGVVEFTMQEKIAKNEEDNNFSYSIPIEKLGLFTLNDYFNSKMQYQLIEKIS